jgi:hypothetical protein
MEPTIWPFGGPEPPELKCIKCGGAVVPGQNGFVRGFSTSPDGDPSGAIMDTLEALHYAEDCGEPDKVVPWNKPGPLIE